MYVVRLGTRLSQIRVRASGVRLGTRIFPNDASVWGRDQCACFAHDRTCTKLDKRLQKLHTTSRTPCIRRIVRVQSWTRDYRNCTRRRERRVFGATSCAASCGSGYIKLSSLAPNIAIVRVCNQRLERDINTASCQDKHRIPRKEDMADKTTATPCKCRKCKIGVASAFASCLTAPLSHHYAVFSTFFL